MFYNFFLFQIFKERCELGSASREGAYLTLRCRGVKEFFRYFFKDLVKRFYQYIPRQ